MENMCSMRDIMKTHSFCRMISCPMMVMQPMNINPLMMPSIFNCRSYNMNFDMYGVNPSIFQVKMKPVSIDEIED